MSEGPGIEGEAMTMEELAAYAVSRAAGEMLEECMAILEEREPGLGQWLLEHIAVPPAGKPRLVIVTDEPAP